MGTERHPGSPSHRPSGHLRPVVFGQWNYYRVTEQCQSRTLMLHGHRHLVNFLRCSSNSGNHSSILAAGERRSRIGYLLLDNCMPLCCSMFRSHRSERTQLPSALSCALRPTRPPVRRLPRTMTGGSSTQKASSYSTARAHFCFSQYPSSRLLSSSFRIEKFPLRAAPTLSRWRGHFAVALRGVCSAVADPTIIIRALVSSIENS